MRKGLWGREWERPANEAERETPFSYPDPDHSFLEIVVKFRETHSITMLTDRGGSRTFQGRGGGVGWHLGVTQNLNR